jgi:carbon storage regulator CsrA
MLVLSSRVHEKIILPESHTSIEVVAIQGNSVRLGIQAPEEVRVLRECLPDRVAEWGPAPEADQEAPTLLQIEQLIQKRLEIIRKGLSEVRRNVRVGQEEDAETLLDKLDEDLFLLRRRVHREVEKTGADREPALCAR